MSVLSGEIFHPDPAAAAAAHVPDHETLRAEAAADPLAFWAARANELEWYTPWDKVLDDSNPPFFKWFTGARTNIVHNCVDRHLTGPYKNKLALIWVGMAYVDRSAAFKKEAKFLRAYMNQLVYPEEGGAATAKAMSEAIRSQVSELQEVTKLAMSQTSMIKKELEWDLQEEQTELALKLKAVHG